MKEGSSLEVKKPRIECFLANSMVISRSQETEYSDILADLKYLFYALAFFCPFAFSLNVSLGLSNLHDLYRSFMGAMYMQVDLLKHGIPDPSSLNSAHLQSSNVGPERENKDKVSEAEEYMATPVFVHTKLLDENFTPCNFADLRKELAQYFSSSSFIKGKGGSMAKDQLFSSMPLNCHNHDPDSKSINLFVIPSKDKDNSLRVQYKSYICALWKLRDQVLSMNGLFFARTVSERDWLKNSAKIWELVKSSAIIADYGQALQSSGMFRR